MDMDFWLEKWQNNHIGFHRNEVNPLLIENIKILDLPQNIKILVPLCGKTLDIGWLIAQGYHVIGVEWVEMAIIKLFEELKLEPVVLKSEKFIRYNAKNIDIFVGDIFDISTKELGRIDLIYDRAALVALPKEMRKKYTVHITDITNSASQLLISYEYDQERMDGPPYSIGQKEIAAHYGNSYKITCLERKPLVGDLKGQKEVQESVWLLK